ncbi:hypothetical protein HPT25_11665 [Bacillus sp. BRMEA1]|uniref:hypothetical protein n=1 Tax=Neobacillus endophyticus TaxID=2738405 RepID=UPI001566E004|nr:hypothetical protein [Neobacillus endophyticus]NRD78043.1 hypothetical protein [Neobacillus endophyticus]
MESINLEDMKRFIGVPVKIMIQDQSGGDQAATVSKTIKKIQLCPDGTHIRFYFDEFYFLAVPLASNVCESEEQWSAVDGENGLTYILKKVQVF